MATVTRARAKWDEPVEPQEGRQQAAEEAPRAERALRETTIPGYRVVTGARLPVVNTTAKAIVFGFNGNEVRIPARARVLDVPQDIATAWARSAMPRRGPCPLVLEWEARLSD